jgi:hypothetical protein
MAEPIPRLIIHAVHGTWPYGLAAHMTRRIWGRVAPRELPWFINGSAFHLAIADLIDRPLQWAPFEWSGSNSFSARSLAAKELSQHLTNWSEREPEAEHVIVAHSHGGSVSIEAVHILDLQRRKSVSKIITMATPFARARASDRDIRELVGRYVILRFGWIAFAIFALFLCLLKFSEPHAGHEVLSTAFVDYAVVLVWIIATLFTLRTFGIIQFGSPKAQHQASLTAPSWMLYAIRAPKDEATIAINTSQFIDFISDIIFTRALLKPFDWLLNHLTTVNLAGRLRLYLIVGFLWFSVEVVVNAEAGQSYLQQLMTFASDPIEVSKSAMVAIVSHAFAAPVIVVFLTAAAIAMFALLGSAILVPANIILAIALGKDLMRYRGLLDIECEPIPSGITGSVSTISLSQEERNRLGLVHFIHSSYAARSKVAEILRMTSPLAGATRR